MDKVRIDLVAGARPNFMKIAPVFHRLTNTQTRLVPRIVHTGQHYDQKLSDSFFNDLRMPRPAVHLGAGSAPVAEQTARIIEAYDHVLRRDQPDLVLVVGDVNSTLGCALAAAQRNVAIVHLEAGLRSFDRTMPEEINRVLTDHLADLLLTPSVDADANLRREGIAPGRIVFVGNIMIDTLEAHREHAMAAHILQELGLEKRRFGLATMHRPSNVDDPGQLADLMITLAELSRRLPIVLPAHPRLRARLQALEPRTQAAFQNADLRLVEPLGYVDFLALEMSARVVLTDSGGVQEETSIFGVPCLTLRENTERPMTIHEGTNRLAGRDRSRIRELFEEAITLPMPRPATLRHWDGQTATRVIDALEAFVSRPRVCARGVNPGAPVRLYTLPEASASRSPEVRRELLLVAETGGWQSAAETERLAARIASYVDASRAVPCADCAGGLAAVRSHYSGGLIAVAGGVAPDDMAAVLGSQCVPWLDIEDVLPVGTQIVYVPPVRPETWDTFSMQHMARAAVRCPDVPFVIDQRWYEYANEPRATELLLQQRNVILLRSLGPAFGLEGLGAGYMLASEEILPESAARAALGAMLPVTRRAAMVALVDLGYMREYVASRQATRAWLAATLRKIGYQSVELPGPYLCVIGRMPSVLHNAEGVMPFADGWLWAVGTPDRVEDLITELQQEATRAKA